MKRISSVLIAPLAARLGTFTGGVIASWGTFDPTLSSRVEAWAAAGAFIAVDLLVAYFRKSNSQEGR